MRLSRPMLLPVLSLMIVDLPLVTAQTPRGDVAPLRHWPAPLYWQPSIEERAMAAKTETTAAEVTQLAQTPVNSLVFVGMTPCRLVDTRSGSGFTGAFGPPSLVAGATRTFPIQSSTTCAVPAIAQAYSFNVTVVPPGFLGYLTIWPYGAPRPLASTLNDYLGTVVANAAIVPAGNDASGSVDAFVVNPTDLVIDINGYYAPQSGITLAPGSVGAPSLSFTGEADTGIYSSGAGTVNIATGGTNSVTVNSNGNVGIGTSSPAATLEVNGNAQVDGGNILAKGSVPVIQFPVSGSENFGAGLGALPQSITGTGDTALGDYALQVNTSGSFNTAVGNGALTSNTTGSSNTASGNGALFANTAGSSNTASGYGALVDNTSGSANTAGGYDALSNNTTGNYNTATGNSAMFGNTTGLNNTGLGADTLYANISGNNNIAVGYQAGYNVLASNNIQIGNQGTGADSGTIRIGTPGTQTTAFIAGISTSNVTGATVQVSPGGQLGIAVSSRRYKEDIHDMGETSSGLMRLRPVTFRYKKAFDDGSQPVQYGLIAEEVAEVYPDLVARSADGQIETVKYQLLDPMLLNELQKQNATITAQKEQIRTLEERLARIEAALSGATVTAASR